MHIQCVPNGIIGKELKKYFLKKGSVLQSEYKKN